MSHDCIGSMNILDLGRLMTRLDLLFRTALKDMPTLSAVATDWNSRVEKEACGLETLQIFLNRLRPPLFIFFAWSIRSVGEDELVLHANLSTWGDADILRTDLLLLGDQVDLEVILTEGDLEVLCVEWRHFWVLSVHGEVKTTIRTKSTSEFVQITLLGLFHGFPRLLIGHDLRVLEQVSALRGALGCLVGLVSTETASFGRLLRTVCTAMA